MTAEEEAADFGHDVGVGVGRAAADVAAMLYRLARSARWVDGAAVAFLVLVLPCCGVWWPWPAAYFAAAFFFDLFMCRKLNPRRKAKRKAAK